MGTKFVTYMYNALQHLHVALNTGDKPAFVRRLHPRYAGHQSETGLPLRFPAVGYKYNKYNVGGESNG